MKVPFVGPAYASRGDADLQECLNCFLEYDQSTPRAPVALHGTPGLALYSTLGNGPHRGICRFGEKAIAVSGSGVYYLNGPTAILLGALTTFTGRVGMASNGTQVIIVDGAKGWLATATTLTEITDADFPDGVTQAEYLSTYFIVTGDGTDYFYWNETPGSGTAWNALDFASPEVSPDTTKGVKVIQLQAWFIGSIGAEVWSLTGDASVFARDGNAFIDMGTNSPWTITKLDNALFWLGQDERGSGIVWKTQGYTPVRVSNHAIEKAIQGYTITDDAYAFTYQQEGHGFYVLTFPTEGKTWVYDVATNVWHQRAYRDPNTGALSQWRPSTYCFVGGKHLVGDYENENLYVLDLDVYTDNGDAILRRRRTQCQDSESGARLFYRSLTIDMDTGVGLATGQGSSPLLMMRYSNDKGRNWSMVKTKSIGGIGDYGRRVRFGPTGAGRNRVWEISMTDPVKFCVYGAYLEADEGTG